jgi:branched-chain amino acid transport system substrate-binding protein
MLTRRTLVQTAAVASLLPVARAHAADTPGVTATEIKIGNTNPHSGPASAYGVIATAEAAYFQMLNEQGGINGRKVTYISLDDAYSPPRTLEQTRRLVEQDGVACMFNGLGTPTQSAVRQYLNAKKVPQLFVSTGADKFGDPQHFPWTMGFNPSYRTEAAIYGKYLLQQKPDAKVGVLYQNDDFGKDYLAGLKEGLGEHYATMVVKEVSYETSDPTIDSQVITLQSSGADALVTAATPKWAAQTIRKLADLDWHPLHLMTNVSISVASVLNPAGPEKAIGMLSAAYIKDNSDSQWASDPGMEEWRAFMKKYLPSADIDDGNYAYGYGAAGVMAHVLKQCGNDLSRANIMKQAASIAPMPVPTYLPGINVGTSATNFHPIRAMQLQKWSGKAWQLFGSVISA